MDSAFEALKKNASLVTLVKLYHTLSNIPIRCVPFSRGAIIVRSLYIVVLN